MLSLDPEKRKFQLAERRQKILTLGTIPQYQHLASTLISEDWDRMVEALLSTGVDLEQIVREAGPYTGS